MTNISQRAPVNTQRMFTCAEMGFLTDNPIGLHPFIRQNGWEAGFAKRIYPDLPSLDETIAAGYGFCANRVLGVFADGAQPKTVAAPGSRVKYGSEPRGLNAVLMVDSVATGLVPAIRKRTDECRRKGLKSRCYIGGLPLNIFSNNTAAQREALLNAMAAFIFACGFDQVDFDLEALDSQEWGKSPTMRLAEKLIATRSPGGLMIEVSIEAQPFLHPGMFEWLNNRFGVIAGPSQWDKSKPGNAGYLRPENTRHAVRYWGLWLQGDVPVPERMKLAAEFTEGSPIVEFGNGMPEGWWRPAA